MPTTTNGSARIGWTQHSDGEQTVLLIMGHYYGQRMWHRVVPALVDRYRVLTFDNRGVGDSIDNHEPFTIDDLADDAVAVLDAAGADRAHVFGVSMGGLTAQQLALAAPERVRSLILGCTGAPQPNEDNRNGRLRRLRYFVPRPVAARLVARSGFGAGAAPEDVREDTQILASTPVSRRGLQHQADAIAAFHSANRVGTISVPTLVIHGDADRTVPVERGRALAEAIPGARLEILPGAGHNFPTDDPSNTRAIVRTFLSSLEDAPRDPAH